MQRPGASPSSDVESSVTLKFPTIPVYGTPASWGSHSQIVTMTSTHEESGDDTTSSLGDSSYDFIDDRSNVTTDDEEQDAMTASTTSSDGHVLEQVDFPPRRRGPNDHGDQPSHGQASSGHCGQEASSGSEPISSQGSDLRATSDLGSYDEQEPIEFDEPSVTNLNSSRFTEVSHTLKMVEKHGHLNELNNNVLDRLQSQLAVTVRQTMTSHSLTPKCGQYKILYVGDPSAREPIIQKIGTALAAGLTRSTLDPEKARCSKFSIVPISAFGEESSPEVVLIDSSGLELTVEDCRYASFARKESGTDSLRMDLSSGALIESTWTGSRFAVSSNWRLPDIAVFYIPDNDNFTLKMTRQFARSFMSRHKVLSIVIAQSTLWDKLTTEPITLDYLTPHICLESRKSSFVSAQIVRRFPIDLTTFLNIDAGQMNRNLACLAAAADSSNSRRNHKQTSDEKLKNTPKNGPWSLLEICESLIYDVKKHGLKGLNRYEYIAGLVVVLMSVLGMLIVGFGLTELLGASKVSNSRVFPVQTEVWSTSNLSTSALSSNVPLALPGAPPLAPSSASSIPTPVPAAKSSSPNTDLAAFLLDAYTLAPDKSEQFKIHVLGDCHIVLRPPHWFSKMKKAPKLLFKVLRGDMELEHQLITLFDGVYALQIKREDAYSMLTVEVWTDSKPVVNENFEVDFGSSWFKVAGWKKATRVFIETVRGDLHSVQTSLSIVYDHTKTGLLTFVQQRRKKVAAQNATEKAILKSHLEAVVKTKELIVAQTRDLQRGLAMRLYATRAAASVQIREKAREITEELAFYTSNKTSMISQQARMFARSITKLDIKAFAQSARILRRSHLREMQKKALRTWWKVRGPPKQQRMKAKAKGPPPVI